MLTHGSSEAREGDDFDRIARLEIYWPTSDTTQVFLDVHVNQAIEVTEFERSYRRLNWRRLPVPK